MSCEDGVKKATSAARKSGVSKTGSKAAFATGATGHVSGLEAKKKKAVKRKKAETENRQAKMTKNNQNGQAKGVSNGRGAQANFFDLPPDRALDPLPTQRQIRITNDFTPEELQRLSIQLRLGAAAVSRHIREVSSGAARGLGHRDPRPLDWAELDREQYRFLIDQLTEARRGQGYIDTSSLKQNQLVELWEFARFEADRAHRNIDHMGVPGSAVNPVGGPADSPTAHYLANSHKLEARFYSFLADQLETIVPAEESRVEEI